MQKKNDDFCGIAFVSFDSENDKQKVLEEYSLSFIDRIQLYKHKGKAFNKLKQKNPLKLYDNELIVEEAPEPSNINWFLQSHIFFLQECNPRFD